MNIFKDKGKIKEKIEDVESLRSPESPTMKRGGKILRYKSSEDQHGG